VNYVYEGDDHLRLIKLFLLQTILGFPGGVICYGEDTVSTDGIYEFAPATALPSYVAPMLLALKVTTTNTGAASVNISTLGAKNLKLPGGFDLPAGVLSTTTINLFTYDGTNFVLLYPTSYFTSTAFFASEIDNGNSSTADTIDWKVGNKQKSTLTGNCVYTFTAPNGPCNVLLKVVQDATGGRTVTWPASVKWSEGVAPYLSTVANAVDIISFYFDGTNYYGALLRNCS
jgi:hypothetical protein